MNLITRILAVDVPANTTLSSVDFTFRGMSLLWLIILLLIVLVGLGVVGFFYVLEKGTLGWLRRILLIGLRSALVILLLLLILRPMLLAEFEGHRPRGVVLLIDNTQSMKQRDRRLTDADKARVAIALGKLPLQTKLLEKMSDLPSEAGKNPARIEIVENVLKLPELKFVERLQKFGPLRPYVFGSDVRGPQEDKAKSFTENLLESIKAEDAKTALADSIVKIVQSKDSDPPSAIVVITDGQDNASKFTLQEAAVECLRHNVPLHIYGVGSSEGGQLQLKEVNSPDTLFVDDTISIPLRWRAQGFKKGDVEITIKLGDKIVAEKKLTLQTGEDLRDALSFVVPKDPEKRENLDLVTTIKYTSGGEKFEDKLTRTLRIADTKIKILYIEHSPRWEYKFLQPALLRDRRLEVHFILVNAAPEVAKAGLPFLPEFPKEREKFFDAKYNLIILGDVASSYFTKEQQEWIREFVQNRGGLIVLAGRQNMPNSYEKDKSPIADVLPVEFKKEKFGIDSDTRTQEYMPTLTEAGLRAEWLTLADTPEESQEVWQKKLLGFHWNFPITKLKPAATSLIVNPRAKMGDQPMPILVNHYYGKGQVLWFGTDETWRWRWNYQDKYFVRFWGQVIYQMGLPSLLGESAKRAQMALDRTQTVVGTPNTIYVRLLDEKFNPRKDRKVEADLEHLDAKQGEERTSTITLNAIPGRPGDYAVLVPNNRPGRYELHVRNPDVNTFSYRVDLPPKHELEESGLAEKALRDAAQLSGGRFYREEDLHDLGTQIEPRKTEFTRRQEVLLWNPLAVILFLGLITMEWLVRKFSDLS
ncbi:MAG: hypothetical protein HYX68_18795 [Planctomycetes bacterium]|nr:hypothetical protein [Planctomycetota bacterium]